MSYHNIWCVYVIMVPSLATTRAILLILLSVFLLFLLLLFHTTAITLCISKRLALKNWTYKAYMKSKNYKFKHQTVLNPFSTNIKHTFLMPNIVNNSSRLIFTPRNSTNSPGGFLRMNVHSLCRVSSIPRLPQALQELPMVCFFGLTCCKLNIRYYEDISEN